MDNKIFLRNPVTVNVIASLVALVAFIAGAVWFIVLMPWPVYVKIVFSLVVVLVSVGVVRFAYMKNQEMSGDISIDLEKKTFTLNGKEYSSFSDLDFLSSTVFASSHVPQASGFSATFITLGVGKNTMVLNSMDAAKGLTLPQLAGLHELIKGSSLSEHDQLLFESFMETVKVIKNLQK